MAAHSETEARVKRYLATALAVLVLSANVLAEGNSVLTGGWTNSLGEQATASVIKFKDGRIKGFVRWIEPEGSAVAIIDLVVDEVEFSADGVAVYLGGVMLYDGALTGNRAVIKVMDNGEGSNGPGPDRESYLIYSPAPGWGINNPTARHRMDTPSLWGFSDWFETVAGNIQVHTR
jgi:hypothetical protein